jgi:hypothetical protein
MRELRQLHENDLLGKGKGLTIYLQVMNLITPLMGKITSISLFGIGTGIGQNQYKLIFENRFTYQCGSGVVIVQEPEKNYHCDPNSHGTTSHLS